MPNQKNLAVLRLLNIATQTTTTNGAAIDLQGYINSGGRGMKAYLTTSACLGTTPNLNVKIQHSDTTTSGDFTDISGATFTAVSATNGSQEEIHFIAKKRYIRYVSTFDANTTSATLAVIVLGEKRFA